MVTVRPEHPYMNLAFGKLRMRMHHRGEPPRDSLIDLSESPIDDPALDMTVSRCERFGYDFEGGIYSSIKKSLTVPCIPWERGVSLTETDGLDDTMTPVNCADPLDCRR